MQLQSALDTRVPDMLRGACVFPLPPDALEPLVAACFALCCGVVLRSAFDIAQPMRIGDEREEGRQILQYSVVVGLIVLFWYGLYILAGTWLVPAPEKLGTWLRDGLGAYGTLLAARAVVRIQIVMFRATHDDSGVSALDEREARFRAMEPETPPGMPHAGVQADTVTLLRSSAVRTDAAPAGSNLPSLLIGVVLIGLAAQGWNTDSLCLWRLPR